MKNIECRVWDTSKPFVTYPKEIRKIYTSIYTKNFRKFNFWINEISSKNLKKINWWLSKPSSRDERVSNLFHNICIFFTLRKMKNINSTILVKTNSSALKEIVLDKIKRKNIQFIVKQENNFFKKMFIFFKEISLLLINMTVIKIKTKKYNLKNLNLLNIYEIEKKTKNYSFYGNFMSDKNFKKKNFQFVPTFISYSPKKIINYIYAKRNFLLKEKFLRYTDVLIIVTEYLNKSLNLDKKFFQINFDKLIIEELSIDTNFRTILLSYVNYFFFKNLAKLDIKINNIIAWNENQLPDKGWSMGVNKFHPKTHYVGYQAATLHPQFFNLSPTDTEYFAGVTPKKIFLVGKKYLPNRIIDIFKKVPVQLNPWDPMGSLAK